MLAILLEGCKDGRGQNLKQVQCKCRQIVANPAHATSIYYVVASAYYHCLSKKKCNSHTYTFHCDTVQSMPFFQEHFEQR